MSPNASHISFMQTALQLAGRNLGQVWPNPAVGCVLTAGDGRILGRGWTRPGGRPHAETEALARAGDRARGATAYVTLEPCAHHGRTPPCADALIAAGIRRAVIAVEDPDPRTAGQGIAKLRAAGVEVLTGVEADAAQELNAGFFMRLAQRRPLVTLKLASTLDGKIACHTGESRWITGDAARRYGHLLRAEHDAILIGAETALRDDPTLTCRLPGMEHRSPLRVVIDRRGRLPASSRLMKAAKDTPLWILTADPDQHPARRARNDVTLVPLPSPDAEISVCLALLAERGITRVLAEGGAALAAALLKANAVDRIAWFHAPAILGADGLDAVAALGIATPDALTRYSIRESLVFDGGDRVTCYS